MGEKKKNVKLKKKKKPLGTEATEVSCRISDPEKQNGRPRERDGVRSGNGTAEKASLVTAAVHRLI